MMIDLPSSTEGRSFETVGWIHLPVEDVGIWLINKWGLTSRKVSTDLDGLRKLTAWTPNLRNRLLLPAFDWTAVLTDGPVGTDLGGIPSLISEELGVVALRAVSSPNGLGRSGARIFEIYRAGIERHVYAAKDGSRWRFGEFGTPLDFEEVDAYGSTKIADRLTEDRLFRYLVAVGVPPVEVIDLGRVTILEPPS